MAMTRKLYFLHVSKTAGTALRKLLEKHYDVSDHKIKRLGHDVTFRMLRYLKPQARLLFFVRDPIARAESGFYDRYRKSQPAYFFEWSKREAAAFLTFTDFNSLAEALSSPDIAQKRAAKQAMKGIRHLRWSLKHFLISPRFLEKNRHRIFFIGDQGSFDTDIAALRAKAKIDPAAQLPGDETGAHRSGSSNKVPLSNLAITNLKSHYADDYLIYEWCLSQRAAINQAPCDL